MFCPLLRTVLKSAGIWLLLLATACVPYADLPLTSPGEQEIDQEILFSWYWQQQKETGFVHIGVDDKTNLLKVLMIDFAHNGEMKVSEYNGLTSTLAGGRYLSLRQKQPAGGEPGYMFLKYRIEKDILSISLMDADFVSEAINSNTLSGKIQIDKRRFSNHITANRTDLQKFILTNDTQLYTEFNPLQRLQLLNK
jgi:hypothetical protein